MRTLFNMLQKGNAAFSLQDDRREVCSSVYYCAQDLEDLEHLIETYDVRCDEVLTSQWKPVRESLLDRVKHYGENSNAYGKTLLAHMLRVSRESKRILETLGYSEKTRANFADAMSLHDLGKIASSYSPSIWTLKNRPTPEQKITKRAHIFHGIDILDDAVANIPDLKNHPHMRLIRAVMLYHHERLDGSGPFHMKRESLPTLMQVAGIVDTYDGDRIKRPHQERGRTIEETLARMKGDEDEKYAGAFDPGLISVYEGIKIRSRAFVPG